MTPTVSQTDLGRRKLAAVESARKEAHAWAARRLTQLGLPAGDPSRAVARLRQELPLRLDRRGSSGVTFDGPSWTMSPDSGTLIRLAVVFLVGTAALTAFTEGRFIGNVCMVGFITPFFMPLLATRRSLTVGQRTLSSGKQVVALDDITSAAGVIWVLDDGKPGHTELTLSCRNRAAFTVRFPGDAQSLFAILAERKIPSQVVTRRMKSD